MEKETLRREYLEMIDELNNRNTNRRNIEHIQRCIAILDELLNKGEIQNLTIRNNLLKRYRSNRLKIITYNQLIDFYTNYNDELIKEYNPKLRFIVIVLLYYRVNAQYDSFSFDIYNIERKLAPYFYINRHLNLSEIEIEGLYNSIEINKHFRHKRFIETEIKGLLKYKNEESFQEKELAMNFNRINRKVDSLFKDVLSTKLMLNDFSKWANNLNQEL